MQHSHSKSLKQFELKGAKKMGIPLISTQIASFVTIQIGMLKIASPVW